jgi:hypothetical protein
MVMQVPPLRQLKAGKLQLKSGGSPATSMSELSRAAATRRREAEPAAMLMGVYTAAGRSRAANCLLIFLPVCYSCDDRTIHILIDHGRTMVLAVVVRECAGHAAADTSVRFALPAGMHCCSQQLFPTAVVNSCCERI